MTGRFPIKTLVAVNYLNNFCIILIIVYAPFGFTKQNNVFLSLIRFSKSFKEAL